MSWTGEPVRLFVGDDWAEDHQDAEVMSEQGRVLSKARLPEGVAGGGRVDEVTGRDLGEDAGAEGVAGSGRGRRPGGAALRPAGCPAVGVTPVRGWRSR